MEPQQQTQIAELRKAMKETKNQRLYERYQAVYLYLGGYKIKEIAQIMGHTRKTISSYFAAYRNGGIEALPPHHSERPPRLSKEQALELKEIVLTKLPSEVEFEGHSNWTLAFIVILVEQKWGIRYSLKGMSLIMKRLGLSHTRPSYTLANADPEKKREFREEIFPIFKTNYGGDCPSFIPR